jgi:hypothetical protein
MRPQKIARAVVTVLVGFGAKMFPVSDAAVSQVRSDPPEGLRLVVTYKEGTSVVNATLVNSGSQPLILNVGIMLANGRQQFADRIQLQLTTPARKLLHLHLLGPAVVAGRVDPMIVPLPLGASYSLQLNLNEYCAPDEGVWKPDLHRGAYTLRAEYTGVGVSRTNLDMSGISLMPYWTGRIQSEVLSFTLR